MRKHLVTQEKSVPSRGDDKDKILEARERERAWLMKGQEPSSFFKSSTPEMEGMKGRAGEVSGASEAESDLNFIL